MALSPALKKLVSNAANKYSRSSGSRIKPKEGVNRYRILAPMDAKWIPANGQFWADLGVHWIKADENGKPLAVVGCPSICYGQPSTIAPLIDQAIAGAIDEESKKLYESWKARSTVIVNVLDRSKGSQNPDEPQILELSTTTWGAVMNIIQEYDEADENILDPKTGLDITITRTGKGLGTQYAVNTAAGKSQPVPAAAIEACHDLYAHIQKEFFRGDENKAIAAIGTIANISTPRIGGSRTPTAALTSRSREVEDAEETSVETLTESDIGDLEEELGDLNGEVEPEVEAEETVTKPAKTEKPAPAEEEVDEQELDDVLADLDDL